MWLKALLCCDVFALGLLLNTESPTQKYFTRIVVAHNDGATRPRPVWIAQQVCCKPVLRICKPIALNPFSQSLHLTGAYLEWWMACGLCLGQDQLTSAASNSPQQVGIQLHAPEQRWLTYQWYLLLLAPWLCFVELSISTATPAQDHTEVALLNHAQPSFVRHRYVSVSNSGCGVPDRLLVLPSASQHATLPATCRA